MKNVGLPTLLMEAKKIFGEKNMAIQSSSAGWVELEDGPGAGRRFYVQRAPTYLRIVEDHNHHWDVLDLLEDEPSPDEGVHVYQQISWAHVRARERRFSGIYYKYKHVPLDGWQLATLRYTARWQAWASVQVAEEERTEQ